MRRIASLTVISGRNGDCDPSVLLTADSKSYLFNVPEQCARLKSELQIPGRTKPHCFCTSPLSSIGLPVFLAGNSIRQTYTFRYVGLPEYASLHFQELEFRRCSSLDFIASASHSDRIISVTPIRHSRTVSFAVTITPAEHIDTNKVDALGLPHKMIGTLVQSGFCIAPDGRVVDLISVYADPIPPVHLLLVDCTCVEDLAVLPDLSKFDAIVHFSAVELLRVPEYHTRFPESAMNVCFVWDGNGCLYSQFLELQEYEKAGGGIFSAPVCEVDSTDSLGNFIPLTSGDCIHWNTEGVVLKRSARQPLPTVAAPIAAPSSFRITFLGTAAGFVAYDRNSAGILVQTTASFVLLDCGPGTYSQLRSHFGRAGAAEVLRNLAAVWISHLHIDHVEGLVRFLLARSELTSQPLQVCCCRLVRAAIEKVERFVGDGAFHVTYHDRTEELALPGVTIRSMLVAHVCPGAMGCLLTMADGKRLVYSGDRIADGELEAAFGFCDVLIHEGTYTSDMDELARAHGHTSFGGALESARKLNARWLFLTHISSRVAQPSLILPEENALVAFDHLSVDFDQMASAIPIAKAVLAKLVQEKTK